jgi:hypothetical protein
MSEVEINDSWAQILKHVKELGLKVR